MISVHSSDMYHSHVFCYRCDGASFSNITVSLYMLWSIFLLKIPCKKSNGMCHGSVSSTVVTTLLIADTVLLSRVCIATIHNSDGCGT